MATLSMADWLMLCRARPEVTFHINNWLRYTIARRCPSGNGSRLYGGSNAIGSASLRCSKPESLPQIKMIPLMSTVVNASPNTAMSKTMCGCASCRSNAHELAFQTMGRRSKYVAVRRRLPSGNGLATLTDIPRSKQRSSPLGTSQIAGSSPPPRMTTPSSCGSTSAARSEAMASLPWSSARVSRWSACLDFVPILHTCLQEPTSQTTHSPWVPHVNTRPPLGKMRAKSTTPPCWSVLVAL
mmetsp:Transcript_93740/g.262216  ORF Transcript_93740/g.262216 Transcript_93740/m.262216 type:complete len:241 (-) Transcript_93740:26-748(-)